MHGMFEGTACGPHGPYIPDVLFWCVVLFFTTVFMSAFLKEFKTSRYFPTRVHVQSSPLYLLHARSHSYPTMPPGGCKILQYGLSIEMSHEAFLSVQVRSIISDFAVFITIFTMILVDYAVGIPSPKLQVPNKFKVSL